MVDAPERLTLDNKDYHEIIVIGDGNCFNRCLSLQIGNTKKIIIIIDK